MKPITISKNDRITTPLEIREKFGLRPGKKVVFIAYQKTLSIVVGPSSIQEARGMFKGITSAGVRAKKPTRRDEKK